MKTVDLTIKQILDICDSNNKNCSKCPLFNSVLSCHKINLVYNDVYGIEYRKKLENEDLEELSKYEKI